jgi:hypothetical protein
VEKPGFRKAVLGVSAFLSLKIRLPTLGQIPDTAKVDFQKKSDMVFILG